MARLRSPPRMGDGAAGLPGGEGAEPHPMLAMGQALVQHCWDRVGELAVCPGCPDPAGAEQSRRLEELILEVDEARQENQRLNRQAARLRTALQEIQGSRSRGVPTRFHEDGLGADPLGPLGGQALGASGPQEPQALDAELLRTKRLLVELQRENAKLKEAGAGWGGAGSPITASKYAALQQQVADLERAHEAAVAQTDRLRQQQASLEGRVFRPGALSPPARLTPPSQLTPPARWAIGGEPVADRMAGSQVESGLGTPLGHLGAASPCGGRPRPGGYDFGHGIGASPHAVSPAPVGRPGPMPFPSAEGGVRTPVASGRAPPALPGGGPAQQAEEVRRRVLAMQDENEQLRRKVRMLASS